MSDPTCPTRHPVKQGDTAAALSEHLAIDGISLDLRNATVTGTLRDRHGGTPITRDAVILQSGQNQDQEQPNVSWTPHPTDFEPGLMDFEWLVRNGDGSKVRFPRKGYHVIEVTAALA